MKVNLTKEQFDVIYEFILAQEGECYEFYLGFDLQETGNKVYHINLCPKEGRFSSWVPPEENALPISSKPIPSDE